MNIEFGIYPLAGIVLSAVLYAVYRFALRMRVTPRTSQVFILAAVAFSLAATFVTPVRMVDRHSPQQTLPQQTHPRLLPVREGSIYSHRAKQSDYSPPSQGVAGGESSPSSQGGAGYAIIYIIGIATVLLHMLVQILWLLWTKRRSTFVAADEDMMIYETTFSTPFSFGHNIFLPAALDTETYRYVLMHEQSHVRHRHFLWLCLMETMVAAQWFNPFAWLLMNELKMQHEMQVDSDMLRDGVERRAYQMSLLNVASNSGRWVLMQTAFGSSPLKFRILFMNRTLDARQVRRRLCGGVAAALVLMALFVVVACQLNPRVPHSPVDGVWTMDWIRNTNGTAVNYPFRRHMKFIANDWLLVISYNTQDGHNMEFGFSAEEQPFHGDTLYNRKHQPAHYELIDGGERHIVVWERDSFQNAMVMGPSITEQWTRIERDADIDYILHNLHDAERQAHGRRILGVWELQPTDANGQLKPDEHHFYVFTPDLFYYIKYVEPDHDYTYCAGNVVSRTLSYPSDSTLVFHGQPGIVSWHDSDHITVTLSFDTSDGQTLTLHRAALPPRLLHALKSTF